MKECNGKINKYNYHHRYVRVNIYLDNSAILIKQMCIFIFFAKLHKALNYYL